MCNIVASIIYLIKKYNNIRNIMQIYEMSFYNELGKKIKFWKRK